MAAWRSSFEILVWSSFSSCGNSRTILQGIYDMMSDLGDVWRTNSMEIGEKCRFRMNQLA